jgi:Na+/H+-dicarboxylate symporter
VSAPTPGFAATWNRLVANPWVVVASLLAGIGVAKVAPGAAAHLAILGDIYLDLLKMVALPFMVAAVVFSLRRLFADSRSSAILARLLATAGGAFLAVALVGLLAGLLVGPGRGLAPDTLLAMGRLAGVDAFNHDAVALAAPAAAGPAPGLGEAIVGLIPSNIFASLSQGETLKVLAFALLFGLAVGRTREQAAETFSQALETVYVACETLTRWFNRPLPVVLFAIVAGQIARTGVEPLKAMGKFLVAMGLSSLAVVALALLTVRLVSRQPWGRVLRAQRDPLLTAAATRSTTACMPAMITALVDQGFDRSRVELLVPLSITLLRVGHALYYLVSTLFVAQLYGAHLGPAQLGLAAAGSVLASIASAGASGLLATPLTGMVCGFLGLPWEAAMALFLAISLLCDMLRTLSGVAGDTAIAAFAAGTPTGAERRVPDVAAPAPGPAGETLG